MALTYNKNQAIFLFCLFFCVNFCLSSPVRKEFAFQNEVSTSRSPISEEEDEETLWNDAFDLDDDDDDWLSQWPSPSQNGLKLSSKNEYPEKSTLNQINVVDDNNDNDMDDDNNIDDDDDEDHDLRVNEIDDSDDDINESEASDFLFLPSKPLNSGVKVRHTGHNTLTKSFSEDDSSNEIETGHLIDVDEKFNNDSFDFADGPESDIDNPEIDNDDLEDDDDNDDDDDGNGVFDKGDAEDSRNMFEDRVFLF